MAYEGHDDGHLTPLLDEHLEENGGNVLPHLAMAESIRWLVTHRESSPHACRSVLHWPASAFERGPDDVRGVIAVSGVPMIPDSGRPGSELRDLLSPVLRRADPWSSGRSL